MSVPVAVDLTLKEQPHALYRFWDAEDRLLYIGLTVDPGMRWKAHRREKSWWTEVRVVTLEWFPDRGAVEAAEKAAIIAESPLHNVKHRVRPETHDLPVVPLPAMGERSPAGPSSWIGCGEASKILEVSTATIHRSLVNATARAAWWGEEGAGWRTHPLARRKIYQVSRKRAEELAARDTPPADA